MAGREYQKEYMRKRRAGRKTCKNNGLEHLVADREWAGIPGFPGYMASKDGYIKSVPRVKHRKNGRIHTTPERVLKQSLDSRGYYQVFPYLPNGKRRSLLVHRAVYSAWVRSLSPREQVDHMDSCKTNNHLDNLQALFVQEHSDISNSRYTQSFYDRGHQAGYRQALKDFGLMPEDKDA
jgi:hypothetical protein